MSVAAVLRSGGRLELGNSLHTIGWRYHKQYFHVCQVSSSGGSGSSNTAAAGGGAGLSPSSAGGAGSGGSEGGGSGVASATPSPELTSAALAHTLHVAPPKASLLLWWCPYGIDSTMHLRDVHGTLTALVQCQVRGSSILTLCRAKVSSRDI